MVALDFPSNHFVVDGIVIGSVIVLGRFVDHVGLGWIVFVVIVEETKLQEGRVA